jgi:mercuric ion transport protein
MITRISRQGLLAVPGVLFSVFPKLICPACWPVYTGLLSAVGLPFIPSFTYLFPATLVFLTVAIVALGLRARQRHGYGPLVLGLMASVAVVVSKFVVQNRSATYAGAGLLIIASLWNGMPRRAPAFVSCLQCSPTLNERHKRE